MSKQVSLAARSRGGSGKGEARALRRDGRVPAVAYGAELAATPLSVDALELYHALHTDAGTNAIIALDFDGQQHLTIAREVHRHPVRRDVLHVDFVTVSRTQRITVDVRVALEGEAAGVEDGGVVNHELFTLSLEAPALEVPDVLTVDISGLEIGDVKRAGDVVLPDGVVLLDDPERTVVSVVAPTLEVEPEEGEEVAEAEAEGATEEQAEAGVEAAEEAAEDEAE